MPVSGKQRTAEYEARQKKDNGKDFSERNKKKCHKRRQKQNALLAANPNAATLKAMDKLLKDAERERKVLAKSASQERKLLAKSASEVRKKPLPLRASMSEN